MASARVGASAVVLVDGRVLEIGGLRGLSAVVPLDTAELFDPATGTWSAAGTLSEARADARAIVLGDGRVLVVGGRASESVLASAELFEPGTRTWTITGGMTVPRAGDTATLLPDGRVLVAGGTSIMIGQSLASAEIFDPIRGAWAATAPLGTGRADAVAVLLRDGTVLVAGGADNEVSATASAEVYAP